MEKFIDRKDELEFLNKEYEKNESSLIILYGRRTGQIKLKQIPF